MLLCWRIKGIEAILVYKTRFHEYHMNVELNTYSVSDAIDFLKRLKGLGVKGIATSPPYNKAFNGRGKKPGSNWKNSKGTLVSAYNQE